MINRFPKETMAHQEGSGPMLQQCTEQLQYLDLFWPMVQMVTDSLLISELTLTRIRFKMRSERMVAQAMGIIMKSNLFEKTIKILIAVIMICATSIMVFVVALYLYFAHSLPSIETLKNYKPSTITKFFSEDGEIISEFFIRKERSCFS